MPRGVHVAWTFERRPQAATADRPDEEAPFADLGHGARRRYRRTRPPAADAGAEAPRPCRDRGRNRGRGARHPRHAGRRPDPSRHRHAGGRRLRRPAEDPVAPAVVHRSGDRRLGDRGGHEQRRPRDSAGRRGLPAEILRRGDLPRPGECRHREAPPPRGRGRRPAAGRGADPRGRDHRRRRVPPEEPWPRGGRGPARCDRPSGDGRDGHGAAGLRP